MFLIDTNCFMQIVRSRPDAPQVQAMLNGVPRSRIFVTDFTLHSLGVVMSRFGQINAYVAFIQRSRDWAGYRHHAGRVQRTGSGLVACTNHHLDFNDAYQYAAAELNRLSIVSLDADFDRTPIARLTPAAALQSFIGEQAQQQQGP